VERLGAEAFRARQLLRPGAWIVNFSAGWCPFCQEFLPIFAALDSDPNFRLAIGDLTDIDSPLWDGFDLEVTPTLIAFRDGEVVARVNGRRWIGLSSDDLRKVRAALTGTGEGAAEAAVPRP
jgi:thioredoxin-like negative regulator of GroEL